MKKHANIDIKIKKGKAPNYVEAYNDLYDKIVSGQFTKNEQIPTENELAVKYNISRGSLRQALAILREDGLIYNVQGRGNFVSPNFNEIASSLDSLNNPTLNCALVNLDNVEIVYNFEPMADIVSKKLKYKGQEIALKCNAVYFNNKKPIAHVYYEISTTELNEKNISYINNDDIKLLILEKLYAIAKSSHARITPTILEENIANDLNVEENTLALFIEEILSDEKFKAYALCKYYFLPEYYEININRK